MIDNLTFEKNGCCVVKSVITKELRKFITQYALFDRMQNFDINSEVMVKGSYEKYLDPAMETLLLMLKDTMEKHTELELLPTYSFFRIYTNGTELFKHTDRPSCEISCSICLDYEFEDKHFKFPIFIEGNEVFLEPGDMVIYKGCELEHWRDKLVCSNDDWHAQVFLHYVDKNGQYSDFENDKRKSIGGRTDND